MKESIWGKREERAGEGFIFIKEGRRKREEHNQGKEYCRKERKDGRTG